MKKLYPLAFIAVVALGLTSCEKDYTCTCTYEDLSGNKQTSISTIHGSRVHAQNVCNDKGKDLGSYNTATVCQIKSK